MPAFLPRFLWTFVVLVLLIVLGTLGYVWIEGKSFADALYMTVITLTAVGYSEVFDLTPTGRTFTIFLLLSGISWMGFWFANITSFIVELDLKDALKRRRTMQDIVKMKDHVIICGAGRTGRQIAQEIDSVTQDYVIIERDPIRIERDPIRIEQLAEYVPDARVLEGDATHDHVLTEAGLLHAHGLITCLSADADNLYVCISARDLAAKLTIVARAYEEESIDKLYRAGADQVVSPNVSAAVQIASVLLRPSVVSFLDIASRSSDLRLRAEQMSVPETSSVVGKTLAEMRIPHETGLIVVAVRKDHERRRRFVFNPLASTNIEAGDDAIVLGDEEQIESLRSYLT